MWGSRIIFSHVTAFVNSSVSAYSAANSVCARNKQVFPEQVTSIVGEGGARCLTQNAIVCGPKIEFQIDGEKSPHLQMCHDVLGDAIEQQPGKTFSSLQNLGGVCCKSAFEAVAECGVIGGPGWPRNLHARAASRISG